MPVIEQNFIFPSDLDPEVFGEKTKGGKKYITVTVGAEGAGTDTNEVQFGTETKTVEHMIMNGRSDVTFVFTEVLNSNQQGKRMFVCTDAIQDGASLLYPSNNEVSPSEPDTSEGGSQPTGDDFTGVVSRTYIGAGGDDKGVIITALSREIRNIPFDIKIVTDRQDIDNYPPYAVIRKVDDGFIITVQQVPESTTQELSFIINDFDPSMSLSLEFPDGKTVVYQPTSSRVPIEEE